MNKEFLLSTETGQYAKPNREAGQLYSLLVATGAEIDRRSWGMFAKPSHPGLLRRAGELITAEKRKMMLNKYDAQEVRDTVDIATALAKWAFADLVLDGGDALFQAYRKGLCTAEEFVRLSEMETYPEGCTCTGDEPACDFCRAENKIKEINDD